MIHVPVVPGRNIRNAVGEDRKNPEIWGMSSLLCKFQKIFRGGEPPRFYVIALL